MVYTYSKIEGNCENHVSLCPPVWKAVFKSISTFCVKIRFKEESQFGEARDASW